MRAVPCRVLQLQTHARPIAEPNALWLASSETIATITFTILHVVTAGRAAIVFVYATHARWPVPMAIVLVDRRRSLRVDPQC